MVCGLDVVLVVLAQDVVVVDVAQVLAKVLALGEASMALVAIEA